MPRRRFRRGAASRADATGDDVLVDGGGDRSSGWLFQSTSAGKLPVLSPLLLEPLHHEGVFHPKPSEQRRMNRRRVSGGIRENYWTDFHQTQWKDETCRTLARSSVQQSISQWRVTSGRTQRGSAPTPSGLHRVF